MHHFFTRGLGFALLVLFLGACGSHADSDSAQQPGTGQQPVGGPLPCVIENLVKSRCQSCHGAVPIGGAPMSLLTAGDFQRQWVVRTTQPFMNQTMPLFELAWIRVNGVQNVPKMPQGNPLSPDDLNLLNSWLQAGAPSVDACQPMTGAGGGGSIPPGAGGTWAGAGGGGWVPPPMGGATGSGGTLGGGGTVGGGGVTGGGGDATVAGNIITPQTTDQCANDPTQFQPLTPREGETCYEFRVHGTSSPTDTSKFTVINGQSYNQFYFDIPWPAGSVATRFGAHFDNLSVLHHWLGFGSNANVAAGTVQPNVTGTTLGEGAELLGGWAVGGCNVEFPPDMGLKLPSTGKIMIQWHHFNSTGAPVQDGSAVQFCVVPEAQRQHIGGLTFLGTENFNGLFGMPAGQTSNFSGTCTNDSGAPITIVGWNPHMHLLGVNMKSVVQHAGGTQETVFDHPFLFDHQVNYMLKQGYVLQPGDKITSTCTFDNTTTANVAFGQSTYQEMCYQFTFSYPYGALNNGVISLIGATNTCW